MSPPFRDLFSARANTYARYRPGYPPQLFAWIASIAPARDVVWDCATGNGQAALPLAEHFARVVATDASATQLAQAPEHPRITWRVAPAEESGLDTTSVDAVTVAQALHWFDQLRFWAEAKRVLRPRGVIVCWSYGIAEFHDPALDREFRHFHDVTIGPFWPAERGAVAEGYSGIEFPFERIDPPTIPMSVEWDLEHLLGYCASWSGTQRYIAAHGDDPVPILARALEPVWGGGTRRVDWPLTILAGRRG